METLIKFDIHNERNLTMLVDFYELTMANGYFNKGVENRIAYFDMYFRRVPDGGGYCIMAGVEQLIQYLSNLKFTSSDIDYLKSKNIFSEEFLDYLENFDFCCDEKKYSSSLLSKIAFIKLNIVFLVQKM